MQNINIQKTQGGFTLIELVIVIVILGILAAVAVPRYVDLTTEATNATCDGIKGGILSSAAILVADSSNGIGTAESVQNIVDATEGQETSAGAGDGWSASISDCEVTVSLAGGQSCSAFNVPANLTSTTCP